MAFPFYKQPDSMDCGPTSLQMVAKYYGKNFSLEELRSRAQLGKDGVTLLGISETAEAIGFRTQPVKIDYTTLTSQALLPAILHWNQNHFIVLYKAKKRKLFVADPGKGLIRYSPGEFKLNWISDKQEGAEEGIALLLEPTTHFFDNPEEKNEKKGLGFSNIFNYLLPYKKMLFQLLLGLGVASILQMLLPFLTRSVIDVGVNTGNIHFIYIVVLAQLALVTGRLVMDFIRNWILLHMSTRINLSILTDFLIKLMRLRLSFFDTKRTGDILQRLNDHSRIESFLTGPSLSIIFALFNMVVFSFTLAIFSASIFTVFIVSALLYSLWVVLFLRKRAALDHKRFEISSKEQSAIIQLVQGMQEIKLNGVEKPMRWQWESIKSRLFRLAMKNLALSQWQQFGAFFINEGKNILITFFSAKAVIDNQMSLGTMLAVQSIVGQLNSPIEQMVGFIQSWQNAKISMGRLNEVHLMEDEDPTGKPCLQELPIGFTRQITGGYSEQDTPTISFNQVSFTYPGAGNEPVLQEINLKIPKGKTTAIVGVSGSGKTTLLKLLLKFYEPQKGDIKLERISLSDINNKFWRSNCGVVMQESFIFSDTIARNIAVASDNVDKEKMQQAIRIACIADFVESLPLGLNTKIGAEGMGISMGQKQRILIARAIYRDPEFIFLDEATNSLDATNESQIVHNLNRFLQGKTVVIVAHRLSTVKHAHQIVVLDKGIIAEQGSHEQLVNSRGKYFSLVKNQLELGN